MIRNFIKKKGDQFVFSITYPFDVNFTSVEMGVKRNFEDEDFLIYKSLNQKQRKVVFIGDSYAEGYTPDGNVKGWPAVIKTNKNLIGSVIKYKGGTGFSNELPAGSFAHLIYDLDSDNEITDVIVAGGWNDSYANTQSIKQGITEFCNISRQKFPNASIKVGMIGWSPSTDRHSFLNATIAAYKEGCSENNVIYMQDAQNSLHGGDNYFSSDKVHPNQEGENVIAENVSLYIPTEYYGGGITKIDNRTYQITIPYTEMSKLDYGMYVYDLRVKGGNIPTTPLSGKLIIQETVYYTKD